MNADDRKLLDLAARVSDGSEIDWETAERSAGDEEDRRVIRHLRLVENLAEVHRSREGQAASAEELMQMTASIRSSELAAFVAQVPADVAKRWGRLEIREELGKGAFGKVYRAWDANLQHEVALKLVDPSSRPQTLDQEEILREGRLLARLRHPNVITVHAAEIHDGTLGISMEMVQGSTLARLLRKQGRFGAREAALIGVDLCRALAAVHGAGLVHRDVKAQNVMRGDGGRILLMDFGAGRDLDELTGNTDQDISGTPLYMAPETILEHESTPRSDLYSLGVLLYHLVTSGYPVRASSVQELAERHRRREARLLRDARSDLPEAFVKVVERALGWEPERRFGSAGEMEQALSDALGIERPAPSPAAIPRRRVARLPLIAIGVMAVITIALFGLWILQDEPARGTIPVDQSAAVADYEIEAALYRVGASGRREIIESGSRLTIGDALTLAIEGSVPLHVYVFNTDEKGAEYALFPLPDLLLQNPLPADVEHLLPGTDGVTDNDSWAVTSAGGREQFVVLASPEPLVEFEAELAKLPRPRPGAGAVPVPEGTMMRLRGIGGLTKSPGSEPDGSADRLFEMAHRLSGGAERVEGVWMREIELLNPEE